ncbi:MAG: hypothetical protein ACJAUY_001622 [Cognaticolwellia sp.]|jgi:hypothetical protein
MKGTNGCGVGAEVIRASKMLTTALSLGAAVSKPNSNVNNAHKVIIFISGKPNVM